VLSLPTDRTRPAVLGYRGGEQAVRISEATTASLKRLAREEGCSLFIVLLAAFKVLVYRYSQQQDVIIGSPVTNRQRPETEPLIGFFVNTLVMRTDLSGEPTFRELLRRVREVCLDAYANQDVPFERLVEELARDRSLSWAPLFQVMFALQNMPQEELKLPGLRVSGFPVKRTMTKFDLTFLMAEWKGGLLGGLQYNSDLFEAETVARMVQNYEGLLRAVVVDPDGRIDRLPLLSEAERHRLLVEWNDTRKEFPSGVCIHELFERQAALTPDAPAVRFEQEQLTYRELDERANQLAGYLRSLGVVPESLVGLCLERSVEMMVGVLGILKAGAGFVPLDPSYPLPRIAYMLEDAGAKVLVSQRSLAEGLPRHVARRVCLDDEREAIARRSVEKLTGGAAPANAAYVIYTSGSTGQPKGVVVEHRQIVNYFHAVTERLGVVAGASFAMVQPLTFDSCQTVVFPALCTGGCLHIVSAERASDPHRLGEYFRRHPIDGMKITSSHLAALQTSEGVGLLLPRRWLVLGGEASRREWAEGLLRQAPGSQVFNHYGPTETTVGMLMYRAKGEPDEHGPVLLPTGRPLANTRAYILDAHMQPVPVGVMGELYIGGNGVARGYLNRPELTAERFVSDPFSSSPGARLYRTGDLARYLADGNVEFLGRADHQVKVRGHRVEPGEIEQRLGEHPAVREAVVVAREDLSATPQLVAYVVPETGSAPAVAELRGYVREALPEYMIPAAFVLLAALPRTAHGKLDRRALPAPETERAVPEDEFVAARTPEEEAMAEIWRQVLKVERVGVHDNFFELGGHSLSAMQVISRVRDFFGVEIQARSLFEAPTVGGLTAAVVRLREQPGAARTERIGRGEEEELLSSLDLLSEGEIEALLTRDGTFEGEER
jgi:amino acid adenylation domain-containing protein